MVELNRLNVAALYVATFDRAADAAGLDYWMNDSGLTTMLEIEKAFMANNEARSIVGMDNREAVEYLYDNLFNKAPADDEAGINYWVSALDSGTVEMEVLILALYAGAQGDDKIIMTNKAEVSLEYANAGLDDLHQAEAIVQNITADEATVTAANNQIQLWSDETETGNFSLTTQEDDVVGTSADNILEGSTGTTVATSTFQVFDNIDGDGGHDTLNLRMSNTSFAATAIMKSMETVNITNQDFSDTFDGVQVSGMEEINIVGSGDVMNLNNLQNIVEIGMEQVANGARNGIIAQYAPGAVSGTDDHQVLDYVTSDRAGFATNGIETLDVHTNTGNQDLRIQDLNMGTPLKTLNTITVDGDANLILSAGTNSTTVTTIDGSAMTGSLNVGNVGATVVDAILGTTIDGGAAGDNLAGAAGNDVFRGNDGADTLVGNAGNDKLSGGAGNDIIDGGAGNDTITGGTGTDVMKGGTGTDIFVFAAGDSSAVSTLIADTITDFTTGTDKLKLGVAGTGNATDLGTTTTGGSTFTFASALAEANAYFVANNGNATRYAFADNGTDGWAFADLNDDGIADSALNLNGVTAMASSDVIA